MKFADAITTAYETKWSFINTFNVEFSFSKKMKDYIGWNDDTDGRNINLHIVKIDTPQFTNSAIEKFVANRWVIHNGRDELYRFSITFRDKNQMELYKKFLLLYQKTREDWFDSSNFSISLSKGADWSGENDNRKFFEFSGVLIESVSQLSFDNTTENQIAEFSIGLKCILPEIIK